MTELDVVVVEEDILIKDAATEQQEARAAAEDLERIEEEVKREAERSVEAADAHGNEKEAVEAAATAFDFEQAQAGTARAESKLEEELDA